jgi:hypothetical protein
VDAVDALLVAGEGALGFVTVVVENEEEGAESVDSGGGGKDAVDADRGAEIFFVNPY